MYLFFKLVILYSTSDTYLVFKAKLSITFFKISSILWNFYDKPPEHQRPVDKKYSVHIHHLHLALKRSKSIAAYIYSHGTCTAAAGHLGSLQCEAAAATTLLAITTRLLVLLPSHLLL